MPLEKIKEVGFPCMHPDHNPPTDYVYSPGTWKHTCPSCGKVTIFEVPGFVVGTFIDSNQK